MTLRPLIHRLVIPALANDPRLLPIDVIVYLNLMHDTEKHARSVAEHSGIPASTLHRSLNRLVQNDWVYIASKRGPRGCRIYVPWMPENLEQKVAEQLQLLQFHVPYRGEWQLKLILDHIVADHHVLDNMRPSWAVSGEGSNRAEFDRWQPDHRLAIEFHGLQHFQKGDTINTTDAELHAQIHRDNLKAAICMRQGYHYVEFTPYDLSYERVRTKLTGLVPLIPIREEGPIFQTIKGMCISYQDRIATHHGKKS